MMYIEKSALIVTFDGYYCKKVTLAFKGKMQIWNTKIQLEMRFYLPNEGLEGLESFALVFLMQI